MNKQEIILDKNIQSDLSLAKRRIYRYIDNLEDHVVIEEVENKYLSTGIINLTTHELIKEYLTGVENDAKTSFKEQEIANIENINIKEKLDERISFENKINLENNNVKKIIFIVGSPRSGTTFLYNLLTFQNKASYITRLSHHKWPIYNHKNTNGRIHFQHLGEEFFNTDTKSTQLLMDVIFPDEGEQIFERAISIYKPIKRNQYEMLKPNIINRNILDEAIKKHSYIFNSEYFICKSPFNSFRIKELAALYGDKAKFIHIHRNGYAVAQSIKDNGFKYFVPGDYTDDTGLFWSRHIESILEAQRDTNLNFYSISYEKLISNLEAEILNIFKWMEIPIENIITGTKYLKDNRSDVINNSNKNLYIEKFNKLLGY